MYDEIIDPGKKPKQAYLKEAQYIYAWLRNHLFDSTTGAVRDNMNRNGRVDPAVYTYNQGTFIGAAHELYKITQDQQYLKDAIQAGNYIVERMSGNKGVLSDATSGDGGLFHGIFFRYFVRLINEPEVERIDSASRKKFHNFMTHCATVMAEKGVNPRTMLFDGHWHQAPTTTRGVPLTPHLSGCMLMEAMCILQPL